MKSKYLIWMLASSALLSCRTTPPDNKPVEAQPPDWRDQVLYFVMTDRFSDGEPSNNDQKAGEYAPSKESHYNGGDLKGITDKLDYIRGLGATGVWITPPVANQWWDPLVNYSGYHGYWTRNFVQVDEHYGTLEDYKALSGRLHESGMVLVQDIVINHTGNFFRYDPARHNANDPLAGFERNPLSKPTMAPTQYPFDQNDATLAAHREAAIYHWTPVISNFDDPENRYNHQLSDLDDLNTDNPVVMDALKDSYNYWIREVGVDGFRIDTVIFTRPETYANFIHSEDPAHPGVKTFARGVGKPGFFTFGETWFSPKPYDDASDRSVAEYVEKDGKPLIDSALNFPLHFTLKDVFAGGRPTHQLAYRLDSAFRVHKDPYRLLNFVDNHDLPRFLAGGSLDALKQGLMFILTIPGVPVIYYGTEQAFSEQRAAMFAQGYHSEGKDHYDTDSEMYRFIQRLTSVRSQNAMFRRAQPRVLADNEAGPGVLAYTLEHEGKTALVLFNTSEQPLLLGGLDVGLAEGTELGLLASLTPGGTHLVVGAGGKLTTVLEPRAGRVLVTTGNKVPVVPATASVTLEMEEGQVLTGNVQVGGRAQGTSRVLLVVDGDLSSAQPATVAEDGTWSTTLQVDGLRPDSSIRHTVVAYVEGTVVTSAPRSFTLRLEPQVLVDVEDPAGDDRGPTGTYGYPLDSTYADRAMDIRHVRMEKLGRAVKITLTMNSVSSVWNPVNGFDHVCFNVYIDVPGRTGVPVLPQANAQARDGLQWDYMALVGGWTNAVYTSEGASATSFGKSTGPAPELSVDRGNRTVSLTFSPLTLGSPASLSGMKLYITTWDLDGGYRQMELSPSQWRFSGADGQTAPLIMDDTPVFTLP
jgi:glycosidase